MPGDRKAQALACMREAIPMPATQRGAGHRRDLAASEALVEELEAADIVVIDMPMHNFTVPAAFKAWVDLVVRPGRTFRTSPGGKVGLLADRPVVLVVACGGRVGGATGGQPDFLTPYVRHVLATIGLRNLTVVRMDSLLRGSKAAAAAETNALSTLDGIARHVLAGVGRRDVV
ncbi:MAG: NAD(P)H-dependent oxidoreductase [Gammaproteobacteria bacterium]|jgi:FMN-dependent NADH-azoreductase